MIFDSARQEIVMYGGADGKKNFTEGWTWNGESWTCPQFESSAPTFYNAPLIYDRRREWAMTFMGTEWGGTWIWEGTTWRKVNLSSQPPLRDHATLVYDPVRDHSILFGGMQNESSLFNDTWIFDGKKWSRLSTPGAPPQRYKAVAFYDPVRRSVILYGGEGMGSFYGDMWELILPEGNQP